MTVSRISVDIDSHVPNVRLRVLRAYHALQSHGAERVEVAVSSSGTGFHLVAYYNHHIPDEKKLQIRENLNDDPNRVKMDRQRIERGLPTQTMWTRKDANEGERQVFETAEDALNHVETTSRTAHERAKRLQNHGRKSLEDAEIAHTKAISAP